ncbi:hypothetical protein IQ264_28160 [Phormidium sp. LEGE 05292]|uniref:hypothetical protein n=1 Tax=[Phormidium] sp. LEGE 05292 TaxID=767427 RepID=UPI001880BEB5|nr:hypothetical protein [Phormidium sp. LEGE 05292]MBE9229284.1 hypothetical protein [Phormidium sp. LEGE 05292]
MYQPEESKIRKPEKTTDIRVAATTKIWSLATGMFAFWMIFSPAKDNVTVPVVIASSAAVGSAFVWLSDEKLSDSLEEEQVEKIERRLDKLETIAAAEDFEMWLTTKYIASRN